MIIESDKIVYLKSKPMKFAAKYKLIFFSIFVVLFLQIQENSFFPAILKGIIGKIHLCFSRIFLRSNFLKKDRTADF